MATHRPGGPSGWIEGLEPRRLLSGAITDQIAVDQFGWRQAAKRIAVFADPVSGQNSAVSYTPGTSFQVRRSDDDAIVFTAPTVRWRSGQVHSQSGDRLWHGDFSSFATPGEYYIYDPANDLRSHAFRIDDAVFADVLKASARTYYYQRSGTPITALHGGNWNRSAGHVGPNQDREARLWRNGAPDNSAPRRDVSGGWYDAGDPNRYVPFTTTALWNLMAAHQWNPGAFPDDWNIPESGNGVPDLLDEIKYELDWLRRMQLADGSVLNRVANASYDDNGGWPFDTQARFYTQATTWATASLAATMAQASRLFAPYDGAYPGYSADLLAAARSAWAYLQTRSSMFPADGTDGGSGLAAAAGSANANMDRRLRVLAAAELFRATGETPFKTYFESNYNNVAATSDNGYHPLGNNRFDPTLATDLNRALVTYAMTPGANATIVSAIRTALRNHTDSLMLAYHANRDDPYLGFMWDGHYTWGSNGLKAEWAILLLMARQIGVTPANNARYMEVAEEYLHSFHGRNPLSMTYLSNMGVRGADAGAERSPLEIYHGWFADGSSLYDGAASLYGAAPGYLVGGPNQFFSRPWIAPPANEPPMKAYKEWNTVWNSDRQDTENSWEITEPAIYYQAGYTLLLSQFVPGADAAAPQALESRFDYETGHSVAIRFSEDVSGTLSRGDFALVNLTAGGAPAEVLSLSYDRATYTATLRFIPGVLGNGRWRLTLPAGAVRDVAGNPSTSDAILDFEFFAADANRDRVVDVSDLGVLASNWQQAGRVFSQGDFNYDGAVDVADLGILATNWQSGLPAAPALTAFAPGKPASPFAKRRLIALLDG